jgi:phosphoglucosamine mutase
VPEQFNLNGLKLVLDCAHGATYQVAPKLFNELGANVTVIGNAPDGLNINSECGSTHLDALAQAVVKNRAALGIAFDGDGDRVLMIDDKGQLVDGDQLVYILAHDWSANGNLSGPVVGTLMSNYGLEVAIGSLGLEFVRVKVGDRHVMRQLKTKGGILGGETSGHILCLNRATTGDGMVSALQILEVMRRRQKSLAELCVGMTKIPQTTVNIRVARASAIMMDAGVKHALDEVQRTLEGRGRVVLRPSGTEPLVRVTVEDQDAALVERLVGKLAAAVTLAAQQT